MPNSPRPPVDTLLVIDDSSVQRAHTVSLCRQLGVRNVHEASNGREAIEMFASLSPAPELILVDLEMPGLDGMETIEELMRRQYVAPLVVVSGREAALIRSVESAARDLGFRVVAGMRKPLDLIGVAGALDRVHRPDEPHRVERTEARCDPIDPALLRRAIEQEHIQVHYQPKVDMRTGIVRGLEALARWTDPEIGVIGPDRFIALAEREGLIDELTRVVMKRALAQTAEWNARGLKLSMAINLSPHLFPNASLAEEVLALVGRFGLQPTQIVLEITETSSLPSNGGRFSTLARFRLKGFGLSIDDYGTGFASMHRLACAPFSELKLDRSFVSGAHRNVHLRVILRSALDMARELGLTTVAEGIETMDDWRLLQALGCTTAQGYLIGRPMAADEIPLWLKRHKQILPQLRADDSQKQRREDSQTDHDDEHDFRS